MSVLKKFIPFLSSRSDSDDAGDSIEPDSVAGGGHGTSHAKDHLCVSNALKTFLIQKQVLSAEDAGLNMSAHPEKLRELLNKPHIKVPQELVDRNHPLTEYFISSSHNTYLLAHQLYGSSSAEAYETALHTGSRCVEIDAWDNSDDPEEPKVTHGFTLTSNVSFRSVCETIRDVVDEEQKQPAEELGYRSAPIFLSLENHCGIQGQLRLVSIMKDVFGERLLSARVRDKGAAEQGGGEHVTLQELGSKICVMVEFHFDDGDSDDSGDEEDSEDEREKAERQTYEDAKKDAPHDGIVPELAALGVYAQSVKPRDTSWITHQLQDGPENHLINVSESGLSKHMPDASAQIARHNAEHLMRVYPKGLRISSKNLNPVPFWGIGAQVCALNWQTFDHSMQLNEALFADSDGYLLKPPALRAGGSGILDSGKRKRLRLHVAGATDLALPEGRSSNDIVPYLTCTLVHPDDIANGDKHEKRKTAPYKQHHIAMLHKGDNPPPTDPVWDEELSWEFEENELVFLRMLVKSDDKWARNPVFCVAAVRLLYVQPGWSFIRLLDMHGKTTDGLLLVKFELEDA